MSIQIGKKFGLWTVIDNTIKSKNWRSRLLCKCKCGEIRIVNLTNLKIGYSKSCGTGECTKKGVLKHGLTESQEYTAWANMIQRCSNIKNNEFKNYGGRGIKVCKRWFDFSNFIKDMGKKPTADLSMDRIDNNGNYTPKNCRWATDKQQRNNKRNSSFKSKCKKCRKVFRSKKSQRRIYCSQKCYLFKKWKMKDNPKWAGGVSKN